MKTLIALNIAAALALVFVAASFDALARNREFYADADAEAAENSDCLAQF